MPLRWAGCSPSWTPEGAALSALPLALTAFAPGLVGFALIAHLGRALFAAGRATYAARVTVAGWLVAVLASLVLVPVLAGTGERAATQTLLALGLASSLGMTVAGVLLLVGAARTEVAGTPVGPYLAGSLPVLARVLLVAAAAAVAGRWTTDRVTLDGAVGALLSGVLGSAVTAAVLGAGLWVTDRDDLRGLLRRGRGAGGVAGG